MKQHKWLFFLCLLLFLASLSGLQAQETMPSTHFDMSSFPQWTRDLRRFEIVAFGAFPILFLYADNVPWPMGLKNQSRALQISAGGAVLAAIVDYGIMRYKRSRLEKESSKIPEGNQTVVRRPIYESEVDTPAEAGEEEAKASTVLSATE